MMKSAVVSAYGQVPEYGELPIPTAGAGEKLIRVEAAAITQLVKGQVSGKHYSMSAATHPPPFAPGADGVGTTEDGQRVYFAFPRFPHGTMAELAVVRSELTVPIPPTLDPARAAALANPAMSSWAALTRRGGFKAGDTVWVLGATGVSGSMALEVCRLLGAGRVVAIGRGDAARFDSLRAKGAADVISLNDPAAVAAAAAAEARAHPPRVVLDYLWGPPAGMVIEGLTKAKLAAVCRWVQIGSLAGDPLGVPAGALRAAPLELVGSGLGSVSTPELVAAIGEALNAADGLTVEFEKAPLSAVASVWASPNRVVLTMGKE